jgi:thioredoxin 1
VTLTGVEQTLLGVKSILVFAYFGSKKIVCAQLNLEHCGAWSLQKDNASSLLPSNFLLYNTMENKTSFQDLIAGTTPVLVDFYADWCAPCRMMQPVLQEFAEKMGERVKVVKINVDKNPSAAATYGVRGIPTFILFKEGKILNRKSGYMPLSEVENFVKSGL